MSDDHGGPFLLSAILRSWLMKRGEIFEIISRGNRTHHVQFQRSVPTMVHYHLRQFTNSMAILSFTADRPIGWITEGNRSVEGTGVYSRREISSKRRAETNISRTLRLFLRNRRELRRRELKQREKETRDESKRILEQFAPSSK